MTKKEAHAEASRRWFVPNPAGGAAICCAFVFLGQKTHPMRYQVGRRFNNGSTEVLGVSTQSWEDAFFNAGARGAKP